MRCGRHIEEEILKYVIISMFSFVTATTTTTIALY